MKKLILLTLLFCGLSASAQYANLLINTNGTLSWNNGTHQQYVRGDGYLDTRIVIVTGTTTSTSTGTTAAVLMRVDTVIAGTMTANSEIRISNLWSFTGTAGTKTISINIDSVATGTGGYPMWTVALAATNLGARQLCEIWNRNSLSVQSCFQGANFGGSTVAITAGAVNTANVTYIKYILSLANSGDGGAMVAHTTEILNP